MKETETYYTQWMINGILLMLPYTLEINKNNDYTIIGVATVGAIVFLISAFKSMIGEVKR